jgi:hypothetical protein
MLMASARIEVDANCKPGDPLTPVLRKHAATYAERVRTEAPAYMQQVGGVRTGGEQRVVVEQHQYVTRVEDGGQAVIGPKVRTRGGCATAGEGSQNVR